MGVCWEVRGERGSGEGRGGEEEDARGDRLSTVAVMTRLGLNASLFFNFLTQPQN